MLNWRGWESKLGRAGVTDRERLPNRRVSELVDFEHAGAAVAGSPRTKDRTTWRGPPLCPFLRRSAPLFVFNLRED